MRTVRRWTHDLWLGVRLAVSGRDGVARLTMVAVGVGLGVAVLLLTVSLVNVDDARKARENGRAPLIAEQGGPVQLYASHDSTEFREQLIRGLVFEPTSPNPPTPRGIDRIPEHGTVYLSPALAALLDSPDGELLRPRFPWSVAGVIGRDGLVDPGELFYYRGAPLPTDQAAIDDGASFPVADFGRASTRGAAATTFQVLLALSGGLLLLIPVLILVAAATRIAAAARERRLAALRLIGADVGQAGRIATGEALVGSVVGLSVGGALFLAATPLAEHVTLFGYGAFRQDVRPSILGVLLIAAFVPALAVVVGLVALRQTLGQPLGATRRARPPRRRLWWRLVPLVAGIGLLVPLGGTGTGEPNLLAQLAVLGGLLLVGISVPLLLPWLLQRAVGPLGAGPVSWQLAVRRIQLDSGTPARAAAGLAALLTVAVAVQTLITTGLADVTFESDPDQDRVIDVYVDRAEPADPAVVSVAGVAGVRDAVAYQELLTGIGTSGAGNLVMVVIGDCSVLAAFAFVDTCTDGDVFLPMPDRVTPGQTLPISEWHPRSDSPVEVGQWTIPSGATPVRLRPDLRPQGMAAFHHDIVLATPVAIPSAPAHLIQTRIRVHADPDDRDVLERVRNALVPIDGAFAYGTYRPDEDRYVTQLRNALLAGSLIVLVLAALSMLIVSVEQIRERRQQLAALAAAGVSGRTLAASVLWQALLPFAIAAAAAISVGVALAWLFLRVFEIEVAIDWGGIGLMAGVCALAVLAVTVLTLPSLRAATRPESLRTE